MKRLKGPYRWIIAGALIAGIGAAVSASIVAGSKETKTVSPAAARTAPAGAACCTVDH